MPVHEGRDDQGRFFQWGDSGKRYYFDESDEDSRAEAQASARRQERAARARGYGKT
jgi:hypothetical protein